MNRRQFVRVAAVAAAASTEASAKVQVVDGFQRPDSLYHGDPWESLNPGYWKIENNALRRRIHNYGDRARQTGFPFHYETHGDRLGSYEMPVKYDPSLPCGFLWSRYWRLQGNYRLEIEATVRALAHKPGQGDDPSWEMYQPGYGLMGLAFGSSSLFESYGKSGDNGKAAWFAAWSDKGEFGIYEHSIDPKPVQTNAARSAPPLHPGDRVSISVEVSGNTRAAVLTATLRKGADATTVLLQDVDREKYTEGFVGLVGRGLLDFEVNRVALEPGENRPLEVRLNDCQVCYALGDTLRETDEQWAVRFLAFFRSDGDLAEIRIAESPAPEGGWQSVPSAGTGDIVNNDFRRNSAVIDAQLPANPAETTHYYTIWKDGRNVTSDPRLGTDAVGLGTGMVGQVPSSGDYVGRLPRLQAPYRLCGLSCHAIDGNRPNLPDAGPGGGFFVYDQPTPEAYRHLEHFDFQIMLWEDDVWYMEHLIYPPSPDDAYNIVMTTLAGPTTRWQMMRHWNVINPGDHDYGMDDVKGPEQLVIRNRGDLGQDPDYMRRNFQIVHHLVTGEESPSGTENPKKWRRWKMPNRDFSLLVLDSRLWRSSQDTNIWDDQGWGRNESLYSRSDPTRSLLGEEQFAWLRETIRTDTSPLICLTGINGMHTVWTGNPSDPKSKVRLHERDRVAADYAGWVSAGVDRILELLGTRDGVVSVYGDVHVGSIMQNTAHRVYECSFGPIGRSGGRRVKEGFGPRMKDFDGRDVNVTALYHQSYDNPRLEKKTGPFYWNFLEMHFDARGADPEIQLRVRNLVDSPDDEPRGGGSVAARASGTGRPRGCTLPKLKTLPGADVLLAGIDGRPIRGVRSLADGSIPVTGLAGVAPGTRVVLTAHKADEVDVQLVTTLPL